MRTALYLRVSTIHQKPDLQADGLRRYATHAGLEIVTEYMGFQAFPAENLLCVLESLILPGFRH